MKGVIYARYSSDNQREESIEGQLRECKEYTPTGVIGRCYVCSLQELSVNDTPCTAP